MKHKPTGCLGKNVSCGVIALYCQNLPPDLRYRPENVFIIAITPAPTGPDALNVHHLLDPIVDQFIPYGGAQGILHPTFHNPIGEAIRARIAPVFERGGEKNNGFLLLGLLAFLGAEQVATA